LTHAEADLASDCKLHWRTSLLKGDHYALTSEIHLQRLHSDMALAPTFSTPTSEQKKMEGHKAALNS